MYQNSSLFTPSHTQAITNPSVYALFTEKPSILIYFDPFRQKLWLQLKILDPLLDSPRPTIRNLRVSCQKYVWSFTKSSKFLNYKKANADTVENCDKEMAL